MHLTYTNLEVLEVTEYDDLSLLLSSSQSVLVINGGSGRAGLLLDPTDNALTAVTDNQWMIH